MSPEETVRASDDLHARVRRFMEQSLLGGADETFDDLALSIARFQAEHCGPIKRLYTAAGTDIAEAKTVNVIQAVPTDAFRYARISVFPSQFDVRVFRTSGTSLGLERRGEHAFRTTETYELGALLFAKKMLFAGAEELTVAVLGPSPEEAKDSSLGFMMHLFAEAFGSGSYHIRNQVIDFDSLIESCERSRARGIPMLLLGASFAYVHLLDALSDMAFDLPHRSRVMQTGGYKGKSRELAPEALRRALSATFGIPESYIVSEYGMTELSSQLYEPTLRDGGAPRGVYEAPPWVRVDAVDPVSLVPVSQGEVGIARIVDLANVDSSIAVQTADQVIITDKGVELLGRAPGATPRGCSLAIDALLSG